MVTREWSVQYWKPSNTHLSIMHEWMAKMDGWIDRCTTDARDGRTWYCAQMKLSQFQCWFNWWISTNIRYPYHISPYVELVVKFNNAAMRSPLVWSLRFHASSDPSIQSSVHCCLHASITLAEMPHYTLVTTSYIIRRARSSYIPHFSSIIFHCFRFYK